MTGLFYVNGGSKNYKVRETKEKKSLPILFDIRHNAYILKCSITDFRHVCKKNSLDDLGFDKNCLFWLCTDITEY